jgi:hypothetical protein
VAGNEWSAILFVLKNSKDYRQNGVSVAADRLGNPETEIGFCPVRAGSALIWIKRPEDGAVAAMGR